MVDIKAFEISAYRWFSRYVIAAMLVDGKQNIAHQLALFVHQHLFISYCYLCLPRLHENHLYTELSSFISAILEAIVTVELAAQNADQI